MWDISGGWERTPVPGTCSHTGTHSLCVPCGATLVGPSAEKGSHGLDLHQHLTFGAFSMKRLASHTHRNQKSGAWFQSKYFREETVHLGFVTWAPALSSALCWAPCPQLHVRSPGLPGRAQPVTVHTLSLK